MKNIKLIKNIKHQFERNFQNVTAFFKKYFKVNKFNDKIIFIFNKIFIFKNFSKFNKFTKISSFNKIVISLISLLFFYLFYLSIPTLYNKGSLQKILTNKIINEFNLNVSISSDISYSILPSPHIIVKNVKIFNNNQENPKELSQIKQFKVFISQKNFFNQDEIKITKIFIEDSNFLIQREDLVFYDEFLQNKFSKKPIIIKKSNFFFKDNKNETITIFPIRNVNLFYSDVKFLNIVKAKGKIFKIPFDLDFKKDFKKDNIVETRLKLNKLKLNMKNTSKNEDSKKIGFNELLISQFKLNTNYEIKSDSLNFKSLNSKAYNNNIAYNGQMDLKPFFFNLSVNLDEINLEKFFYTLHFFQEFLKKDLLFNKNLSAQINLKSKKVKNNKLFDESNFFINFENGKINFNDSILLSKKIGLLRLNNSSLIEENDELLIKASFVFSVDNKKNFFRTFLVKKNNKIDVKNIYFDIEYNPFRERLYIDAIRINDPKSPMNELTMKFLDSYNSNDEAIINNWIDLKNLTNTVLGFYSG